MELKKCTFDIECYINYCEIKLMCMKTGKVAWIRLFNDELSGSFTSKEELRDFINRKSVQLIGFNSIGYDMVILTAFLQGKGNSKLKEISDDIIVNRTPWWTIYRKHKLRKSLTEKVNHIDICQPAPGVQTSLKLYGGRLGAPRMQDLPVDPSETLNIEQVEKISLYCDNDLDVTKRLFLAIEKQIKLREDLTEKYGVDLRSKSDAQMAEGIFKVYLEKEGVSVGKRQTKVVPFKYRVPEWVEFESPVFNEMLDKVRNVEFKLSSKNALVLPKELDNVMVFDGVKYKFGIGGLHSQEKCQAIIPNDGQCLGEFDVASMYPSIIIEQELYPLHLGSEFLDVYSNVKDDRLLAKRTGDTVKNQTYKIVLNGSYGKFGSQYSFLFSPELLIQTTITGQLSLLMLIEKMAKVGGKVVSANTDGVNVLIDKSKFGDALDVQTWWEFTTGYELEYTSYLATYSRDVNNYLALKPDGVKGKGVFADPSLMKNPSNEVCVNAIKSYLLDGDDIEGHILSETDPLKFCTIRTVTGGAMFKGEEVGKVVRFYHSTNGDVLTYKKNGNKVPTSEGCKPLMNVSDFNNDIDYSWYVNESKNMLKDLGL